MAFNTDPVTSTDPNDPFGIEQEMDREAVPAFANLLDQSFAEEEDDENSESLEVMSEDRVRTTAMTAAIGEADSIGDGDVGTLVAEIGEKYTQLEAEIRAGGESNARIRAAYADQSAELANVLDVVQNTDIGEVDPALRDNAIMAFNATLDERAEERAGYALERTYNDSLIDLSLSDPNMAYMLASNEDMGSALDTMADRQTRRMIMQREIERTGRTLEDREWFFWGIDLVHRAIPFIESTAQTGNVEGTGNGFVDWLFPGGRIRREAAVLNDPTVPLDQYTDNVRAMINSAVESSTDWGYTDVWQAMDIMRFRQNSDLADGADLFAVMDNLLPFYGAAKAMVNIPGRIAANGARQSASRITADLLQQAQRTGAHSIDDILGTPTLPPIQGEATAGRLGPVVSTSAITYASPAQLTISPSIAGAGIDNLASTMLPKLVNPGDIPVGAGTTGLVLRNLERGKDLIQRVIGDLTPSQRLVGEEIQEAIKQETLRFGDRLNRDLVLDINARSTTIDLTSGASAYRIEAEIGKKNGDLFSSERAARRYTRSMGIDDDAVEIVNRPEGVFVRVSSDVSETGAMVTGLESRIPSGPFAGARRFASSARGILDEGLMGAALSAGNRRNAILSGLREMAKPLAQLNGSQLADLDTVMQLGRDGFVHGEDGLIRGSQWFSDSQLDEVYRRQFNRSITPKERVAYHSYRNVNDMEYALRNDERYLELFNRGYEEISIDGLIDRRNGRVLESFNPANSSAVFSVTDNAILTPERVSGRLSGSGDHVIIALTDEVDIGGTSVSRMLVRRGDLSSSPLARVQLPYNPGGHRMYEGSYFSKQARFAEGGHGRTPQTFIVGKTKAEIDEWNGVMEQARLALIRGADEAELDQILGKRGLPTGSEFIEGMEDGLYQRDMKFRTVYDRDLPEDYKLAGVRNFDELRDEASAGVIDMSRTRGQMYYGRRGDGLRDFNGDQAAVLNVYDTIDQSIQNIAEIAAFGDFKTQAINRWFQTYKGDINLADFRADAPVRRIFADAAMVTSDDAVRQAAEGQRDVINRILNWRNPADLRGDRMVRGFAEWLGARTESGTLGRRAAEWASTEGVKATPISWLRGIAFDLKLGMFNIAQFPLQISTILASTSIDPVRGMQGMKALPFVRKFFATSFDEVETALEGMISRGIHKEIGFNDVDEFRAYMKDARQSGFLDVSAQATGDLGRQADTKGGGLGGGLLEGVREAGRIPFTEAEVWNRIVGRHIAWSRLRKQMPDLDYNSPAFHNRLATLQDDFTLNMQRESQAAWQQGLLGLPTQFFSYQARMLEMMMSKRLSGAERARLVLGQAFFYGSGGVPLLSTVSDVMTDQEDGQVGELNTWRGFFDRGALDHIIWNLMEADVEIGDRLAVGGFIEDQVRNIMNMSSYGETSFFDVATGATGGITLETTTDFVALMWAAGVEAQAGREEGMPITRRALDNFLSNASGFSNGLKAYTAFTYGTYVSNSGTVLAEGLAPVEAAFLAFSYKPGSVGEMSARMNWSRNRSEAVQELASHRSRLWSRYITEPNNRADILTEMNAFMSLSVPPELRADVIQRTRISSSTAQSVELNQSLQARQDRAIREGGE